FSNCVIDQATNLAFEILVSSLVLWQKPPAENDRLPDALVGLIGRRLAKDLAQRLRVLGVQLRKHATGPPGAMKWKGSILDHPFRSSAAPRAERQFSFIVHPLRFSRAWLSRSAMLGDRRYHALPRRCSNQYARRAVISNHLDRRDTGS